MAMVAVFWCHSEVQELACLMDGAFLHKLKNSVTDLCEISVATQIGHQQELYRVVMFCS